MSSSTANMNNFFFQGNYKHAWKKTIPPGLTEAEVDFIKEVGLLNQDARVLDLMCGYGRHSLELARRGIAVTAIDNLEDYVREIGTAAQDENLDVRSIQSDVLTIELDEADVYDAAICMGNSFAFFEKSDGVTILKNISRHLKPEGIFILNSWMIAEIAIKYFREKDWHYAGDYKCILEYRYSLHPSRIESEQTIISPHGDVEVVKGVDYIFTLDELEEMFNEAGLRTRNLYSTPRKRKFSLGDSRIYIVAEKA
jgi:SAM-dependent methyltransferase